MYNIICRTRTPFPAFLKPQSLYSHVCRTQAASVRAHLTSSRLFCIGIDSSLAVEQISTNVQSNPLKEAGLASRRFNTTPLSISKSPTSNPPGARTATSGSYDDSDPSVSVEIPLDDHTDPKLVFDIAWNNLVEKVGEINMVFPKDIMWLAGAPGAGKGVMTKFILEHRGITSKPIETSSLLNAPELEKIKADGGLVGDRHVVELILQKLLEPEYQSGVIVDGFPRTFIQGQCIALLYDKMRQLRRKYDGSTEVGKRFRRPIFHITILFVEEDISVQRQMGRGGQVKTQNKIAETTGLMEGGELRATDEFEHLARKRYRSFMDHVHDALTPVKSRFEFHFINADGTVEEVKNRIIKELQYQSSLELNNKTFEKVRQLPLSLEITSNARYELVHRLENYVQNQGELFDQVIDIISTDFVPIIKLQGLAGKAVIRSESPVFDRKLALNMALDLFCERGFVAHLDFHRMRYPNQVINGQITLKERRVYEFHIEFQRPNIRGK